MVFCARLIASKCCANFCETLKLFIYTGRARLLMRIVCCDLYKKKNAFVCISNVHIYRCTFKMSIFPRLKHFPPEHCIAKPHSNKQHPPFPFEVRVLVKALFYLFRRALSCEFYIMLCILSSCTRVYTAQCAIVCILYQSEEIELGDR